jgi:hypothetical protein
MPGLVPGIHVFVTSGKKDVDGRAKPGHDEREIHFQPGSPASPDPLQRAELVAIEIAQIGKIEFAGGNFA